MKLTYGFLGMHLWTANLKADFQNFFLDSGSGKQLELLQSQFSKLKLPYGDLGMDSIKVNLQPEFQKFYLDMWKWWTDCNTCKLNFEKWNCLIEMWEWFSQQLTCKLNFKNSFWISRSGEQVVTSLNWISKIEIDLWISGNASLNS